MYKVGIYKYVSQDEVELHHVFKFKCLSDFVTWFDQHNVYQFDPIFLVTVDKESEGDDDVDSYCS